MNNNLLIKLILPFVLLIPFSLVIIGINSKNPSPTLQSNWVLQTNLQSQLRGRSVSDMVFTDSLTGYAVTPYVSNDSAFIIKTSNGGNNWFIIVAQPSSLGGFSRIRFINNSTGFTCGNYLRKTLNAGNNWNIINTGSYYPENMYVLNEDTIYITYHESMAGGIFRTINGGGNWQQIYSAGLQNPQDIYMYNVRIGFYCSPYSKLFKTTDGGYNWSLLDNNNGFLDIKFIDSLTGYRAFSNVQKTTNGGLNWITQVLPIVPGIMTTTGIIKFQMINKDTILGVGGTIWYPFNNSRGLINKTTNGGLNWGYQLPDTHNIPVTGYAFVNFINYKKGWIYNTIGTGIYTNVGGDSTLYSNINEQIKNISLDFKLLQNYPNPFNSITNVKVQMFKRGFVEIKIFDLTGKFVDLLINKYENQGEYTYKFDATIYSSGIYFYSLFVDGMKIDTKKLILLK